MCSWNGIHLCLGDLLNLHYICAHMCIYVCDYVHIHTFPPESWWLSPYEHTCSSPAFPVGVGHFQAYLCRVHLQIFICKKNTHHSPGFEKFQPALLTSHSENLHPLTTSKMQAGRKWQPTPVFLPGESQGQRSLVGCRLWGHTESDTTAVT